jgi:hypothetical protein
MTQVQPVNAATITKEYYEMRIQELEAAIAKAEAKRLEAYHAWKKASKEALLAEFSRHNKIHGLTIKDTKSDLLNAVININTDTSGFEKNLKYIRAQLAKLEVC